MDKEFLNQDPPDYQQEQSSFNIRDIINTLFKRKLTIFIVFIMGVLLAVPGYYIQSLIIRPAYEAYSILLIKFGREFLKEALYQPELTDSSQVSSPFNRRNIIGSETQILLSRKLKEEVLKVLGIERIYPNLTELPSKEIATFETALLIFEKNLFVTEIRNSDVIRVSFTHQDPEIAAEVVNLLVDLYQVRRLEILSDPRTISFLKKVLDEYSNKVKESEEKLNSLKNKYGIYSLEEQKTSLLEQRTNIDTTLKETKNRIGELKQILSFLENQIQMIPKLLSVPTEVRGVGNPLIAELESRLIELKIKEKELLQKFKKTNTWVVNVREEMRLIKDLIEKEKEKIQSSDNEYEGSKILEVNTTYQQMELDIVKSTSELKALEAKEINLIHQRKEIEIELQNLYLHEREYKEVVYDLTDNKKNYQILYKKYEEASISEQMDKQKMTSISVIQKAMPPIKPIKDRKGIIIFIAGGIFIGLVGGIGTAVLLEYINKVVSTPEKAEKVLGLPVLATVPFIKNK